MQAIACLILFTFANVLSTLLAKMMASHFHKATYFHKMQEAIRKVPFSLPALHVSGMSYVHIGCKLQLQRSCVLSVRCMFNGLPTSNFAILVDTDVLTGYQSVAMKTQGKRTWSSGMS